MIGTLLVVAATLTSCNSTSSIKDGYRIAVSASSDTGGHYLMYQMPKARSELVSGVTSQIELVDEAGQVRHRWQIDCPIFNAKLYKNFEVGVACYHPLEATAGFPSGTFGQFVLLDRSSKKLWIYNDLSIHHDFERVGEMQFLFLSFRKVDKKIGSEASRRSKSVHTVNFVDDVIEVDRRTGAKRVVWDGLEYLENKVRSTKDFRIKVPSDPIHLNSIRSSLNDSFDDRLSRQKQTLLLVSRNLEKIFLVDSSHGEIVWESPHGTASFPHDASFISDRELIFFNNGGDAGFFFSSNIKTIDFVENQVSTVPFNSQFLVHIMGGVQRLRNGNLLVTHSPLGYAFEVNSKHETVMKIFNRGQNSKEVPLPWWDSDPIFRVTKYYDQWLKEDLQQ